MLNNMNTTDHNQQIANSFQLYGSAEITQGLEASFRLVQFDNDSKKNLPCQFLRITVEQPGREPFVQVATESMAVVPADFQLSTRTLATGPANLTFSIVGWDGKMRDVKVDVNLIEPRDNGLRHFAFAPVLQAPLDTDKVRLDLVTEGGGLVEGVDNRMWLRVLDDKGKPLDKTINYRLGDGTSTAKAPRSGRLGLTYLDLVPRGINQNLHVSVVVAQDTILWEEMVAPHKLVRLSADSHILTQQPPILQVVTAQTFNAEQELFCTLWRGSSAVRLFQTTTQDNLARINLSLPVRGFYWLTCSDHFLATDNFQAYLPIVATGTEEGFLHAIVSQAKEEPHFANLPPVDQLRLDEKSRLGSYLAARMVPEGPVLVKLVSTYGSDLERLRNEAANRRDIVLLLIGLVGLGLLAWAVAVAIKQHSALTRSFKEFQDSEDVGEELSRDGITRKRSYLPAILIVLTVLANLIALIWILRLVFF